MVWNTNMAVRFIVFEHQYMGAVTSQEKRAKVNATIPKGTTEYDTNDWQSFLECETI